MSVSDLVAVFTFVGVVAYAVFGGADFGTGFWDITAGDAKRGGELRTLIDHSIGPVWEANHVWLIFILVMLWTGFPHAFAAMMTTLAFPLAAATAGIVARGAGFAFRKFSDKIETARMWGLLFASSSVIAPFFFGTVAGAVASGRVPATGYGDPWRSWTGPTSLVGGVLSITVCAYLAGVFLTADANRHPTELVERLRKANIAIAAVTGLAAVMAVIAIHADAPTLFHGLTHRGAPVMAASAVSGATSLWAIVSRRYELARVCAVVAVGAVVAGWGIAQYPWMLVDRLSIAAASGARVTQISLLAVAIVAVLIVAPSLGWLYSLARRDPHQS